MGPLLKYLNNKNYKRGKKMKIKMRWFWLAFTSVFIYLIIKILKGKQNEKN